ncbi:MAG: NAD(P)/FAD-dependent oxidoreductase [Solirubrobacterales bacterium]|jgi:flavin-dependent dehydrogenase|nr:NAD(P)/FAD-dependent oxidoreductase [Solirubrobacterales bacterium]
MPVRATKRGAQRTSLTGAVDVLVCGASFAGLTVARELRASGARVLLVDRYEIGERQTSACAAPTEWLENLGLTNSIRQTFDGLVTHTPGRTARWPLPFTFSTFDYGPLCADLWAQCGDATFETAKVNGCTRERGAVTVHTDRGDIRAPLVVDALGWRRVLGAGENVQPPNARLSRGLEVHPPGGGDALELWIDRRITPIGYGWAFPAGDEVRIGIGSFDPHHHIKGETNALSHGVGIEPKGYQGNWIPHKIRPAVDDGVFFVGDSAGHCIPLSAEGIRTAFYFGIACGRELRSVLEGRQARATALERYGRFSRNHEWKFDWMLRWQQGIPRLHPRLLSALSGSVRHEKIAHWAFNHYFRIADPAFAFPAPPELAASLEQETLAA